MAQVGTELEIQLDGTDKTGARLAYSYRAPDLTDLDGHAEITVAPSGAGVFRWTPLAADVGNHPFDFIASNGGATATVTINIDVKSAIGAGTAPVFREPLGTGTTVDMATTKCVNVNVVVEDQASANVKLAQQDPVIIGSKLIQKDGQSAAWSWCPTVAQQAESRYTLVLSADDGQNPKTIKDYLIVLRNGAAPSCPGSGPMIAHTPANATTRLDLKIDATISDSLGLKDTPLLYYSLTDPGARPDVSTMTQVSATLKSGTNTSGTWEATIPNPVANAPANTTQTVYYVLAADDHDTTNNCDHVTTSQVYSMVVTAGGGATAGLCQACTADSQCGAGNECVYMGSMGASYCLEACGSACPTGYSCSVSPVSSVGGAMANQCVPQSGSCAAPAGACTGDLWDPDDTMSEASANGAMSQGAWDLVSCPSPTSTTRAADDWFQIVVPSGSNHVDITLAGDGAIDLDLHLYHSNGDYLDSSVGPNDHEQLHDCVSALTYYVKVDGYGYARDAYTLTWNATHDASCP